MYQLADAAGQVLRISGVSDLARGVALSLTDPACRTATRFRFERAELFTMRESELLARYAQAHGQLPPGNDLGDDLFGTGATNAIGQRVRINGIDFRIIGITVAKGGSALALMKGILSASAPLVSRMVRESPLVASRKLMRVGMLALMRPVMTSTLGRCVARMR